MPPVVRFGDLSTGHECWPGRPNNQASTNVFANNLGVHRVGDSWFPHTCGIATHSGIQATGSPNVFVNNKPVARIGDQIACAPKDTNATGSPNVIIN